MSKRNKIIYWIATVWFSLGMTSAGIIQILHYQDEIDRTVDHLGYPLYLLTLLGVLKLLGVIVLLIPKVPLLKEWAYAGFFFNLIGALYSHFSMGDPFSEIFPAMLLLTLLGTSWYLRPGERKIISGNPPGS